MGSFSLVTCLGAGGCGALLGGTTADLNSHFIIPELMRSGDVAASCAVGEGLGPMVQSFAAYSHKAGEASVLAVVSAALCLEVDTREAQLAQDRAWHAGRFDDVKDAAILEERAHLLAARRYLDAFQRLDAEVGVPGPGEACPKLRSSSDQLTWLMGLSAGLLAVLHDAGASGAAGVPLDIPAAVVRGSTCLDDPTWWGAPSAMRASIFVLQPGHPDAGDAWATLDAAVRTGDAAGVRLATAYLAQAAGTVGEEQRVRQAIRHDADARAAAPSSTTWAMLDRYAGEIVLHQSDRTWTRQTGHRTPMGALGTFPDDVTGVADPDFELPLEDLLK